MEWVVRGALPPADLSGDSRISQVVASVLARRGLSPEEQVSFLFSPDRFLNDPFLMPDMDKAVCRVKRAVENRERVVICGDYDADGVTGTSLLVDFFRRRGMQVGYYIPNRLKEGYGLTEHIVERVAAHGADLIITVDNGSLSKAAIALAASHGIDTIITDHHQLGEGQAAPFAFLNPHLAGSEYPCRELAGVGVAFKLVHGYIMKHDGEGTDCALPALNDELISYLDLVAVGTVADVVNLTGENRYFVIEGLKLLNSRPRPGLEALLKVMNLKKGNLKAYNIGFGIGPRINAAGRVARADMAVSLLTGSDMKELYRLAGELERANTERQELEKKILVQAERRIKAVYGKIEKGTPKGLVVDGDWHPGVIGIAASRIAEKYFLPTIIISTADGAGRGSARSISSFHILDGIKESAGLLDSFGGHRAAAGLKIDVALIDKFRESFDRTVVSVLTEKDMQPVVKIDGTLHEKDISFGTVGQLGQMEPFGMGNPEPVFILDNISLRQKTVVGKRHLKLKLEGEKLSYEAIGFNQAGRVAELSGNRYRLCGNFRVDSYGGRKKMKIIMKDICSEPSS